MTIKPLQPAPRSFRRVRLFTALLASMVQALENAQIAEQAAKNGGSQDRGMTVTAETEKSFSADARAEADTSYQAVYAALIEGDRAAECAAIIMTTADGDAVTMETLGDMEGVDAEVFAEAFALFFVSSASVTTGFRGTSPSTLRAALETLTRGGS